MGHSIRCSHSKGVADIDPIIALQSLISIALPEAEIVNSSFGSRIYPQVLKIAKVVSVFKKGSKYEVCNYLGLPFSVYLSRFTFLGLPISVYLSSQNSLKN